MSTITSFCRGHVDNDMMLGNVQGALDKHGLLDKYDVISACCFPEISSFGPFTLYRNVPQITELFRHMESYYSTLNSPLVYVCDEWGGVNKTGSKRSPGPQFWRSMSNVLTNKRRELNVRIHSWGLPFGYDKSCVSNSRMDRKDENIESSCGYCRWTAGNETSNSQLVALDRNRGLYDPVLGIGEVMFCHFQFGKKTVALSIDNMPQEKKEQFWAARKFEMTYHDGFGRQQFE